MESQSPTPPSLRSRRRWLVVAYLAVSLIWGSTFLGIRIALESYPPFFLAAVRFLVAGSALYLFARVRGEPAPTWAEWRSAILTGALFFVIGNAFINVAERTVSSGIASVLAAMMPLWTTVFARLFGQRFSRVELAGLLLGLVGVAVLNLGGDLRASPTGAAFAFLAPMGWALGSIVSRRLPAPRGTIRVAAQMLAGGALMLVIGLCAQEHVAPVQTARSVVALAYLAVVGSLIGFSAYSYLLRHTRPAIATSYAYVNPVVALVLGGVFGGEHFGITSIVGAVIVLAAVVLTGLARSYWVANSSTVSAV